MDQDSYRQSYHTLSKTYFSNKNRYSENIQKQNKATYNKQQAHRNQYITPSRTTYQNTVMNQLAPRFQQRALYSQYYRTDYESSWRANLLAASYRARSNHKKPVVKIINLGERPDPEGAPSYKSDECDQSRDLIDYERILNHDISLYSDYGSDSEDVCVPNDEVSQEGEKQVPDSSWSTASLLSHAFNKASSNKVTIMSYAVIGAELNSIIKLHTTKTEDDLGKLAKKTQRLTENIDNARKSLKDIALGLRSLKQDIKSKNKRSSSNQDQSLKYSSTSLPSQSDLPIIVNDTDRRTSKRRSSAMPDKMSLPHDSYRLPDYYTFDRRHTHNQAHQSNCLSDPKIQMIKNMNLDMVNKRSSSDEY